MESEKPQTKTEDTAFELDQRAIKAEEGQKALLQQVDSLKKQLESVVDENEALKARIKDLEKVEVQAQKTEQQMVNVAHEKDVQVQSLKQEIHKLTTDKAALETRMDELGLNLQKARQDRVESQTQADERFRAIQDMKELVKVLANHGHKLAE